ncbi:hypothetical protein TGDOM2_243980 [Toxoplasma gondii GAB2-2007-GAL-DOM2]|uniref:Uncharacterized protein n=5 Tax=Toxoplasma gondii TaxID=5811 RepID=S7VN47_TOXGG|nr:hypothetical protein TGGT1_243980 [Toxoplasma gondii GT1]KAF4643185.1 hypothetical protein TGRH88_028520 [Toxoplasma gondii]KFG33152.1 hypothetical protein TGDOM2_243980 [Toxoplasma gondii GAB2-2007-GAL-DOM2]KFG51483.1 hypothetical protein TGFOU_243980 [Toxoplasma gondii FOU]RQX69166.1 hypothetical protein TGCAST_243980 [Toxoplasma gondii CAST]
METGSVSSSPVSDEDAWEVGADAGVPMEKASGRGEKKDSEKQEQGLSEEEARKSESSCSCSCRIEVEALQSHNARLHALNTVLLTNMSSLYKTAKEEVKRRDALLAEKEEAIAQLRSELQSLESGLASRRPPHRKVT